MSNDIECEILRDDSIASTRAGQTHHCAPVAQTRSVIQQMPDSERRTVIGKLGDIFSNRIIDTEFSLLLEQYERCGGELLRNGAGLENCLSCVGNVVLHVGKSERLFEDRFSVERHRSRTPWTRCNVRLRNFLKRPLGAGNNLCFVGHLSPGCAGKKRNNCKYE
jgi:hypothetical protein